MAPRTWRFWCCGSSFGCCGSSFGCCVARAAAPGSPPATGSCSPPPAGCSHDSSGHHFSSRPRRCCAGTARWSGGSGPTARSARLAGHRSTPRSSRSCCAWRGRIPGGVACGSAGNCVRSGSGWAPRPSGRCCDDTASARRHDAPGRPGAQFLRAQAEGIVALCVARGRARVRPGRRVALACGGRPRSARPRLRTCGIMPASLGWRGQGRTRPSGVRRGRESSVRRGSLGHSAHLRAGTCRQGLVGEFVDAVAAVDLQLQDRLAGGGGVGDLLLGDGLELRLVDEQHARCHR